MIIKKWGNNDYLKKIIKLKEIRIKDNKGKFNRYGGMLDDNIIIISDENEYFYGWLKNWNKCKININDLREWDRLELEYEVKNGYKNWKKVKKLDNVNVENNLNLNEEEN